MMFNFKKLKFLKKKEFLFLSLLFLIGFFLRTFRLNKLLLFAYDQGSDAIILMDMIKNKKFFRLIGPETGLGGVFLGPLYYYLILPFYWLGKGNPVYPAVFLSFLGALAIPAVYFLGRRIFGKKYAFIPPILLTFSFGAIEYARWLCNPPPMILFSIFFIFSILKSLGGRKFWSMLGGVFLGFCLQLEFANAIFYLPLVLIYPFFLKRKKEGFYKFILFIFGFLVAMLPLFVFDLRHDYIISNVLKRSMMDKTTHTSLDDVFQKRPVFYKQFFKDKLLPNTFLLDILLLGVVLLAILKVIVKTVQRKREAKKLILIVFWFLLPLVGLYFYTGNYGQAWDYYLIGQIVPALLLITYFLKDIKSLSLGKIKIEGKMILAVFLTWFAASNYHQWGELINPENYSYSISHQLKAIDYTFKEAKGEDFSVFIFVPNGKTESYDYLYSWESKKKGIIPPSTTSLDRQKIFLIYEPDPHLEERFYTWYERYVGLGIVIDKAEFGIITVEQRINEK